MKKLSKDAESRILTALESVADSVNEGTSPNDAIVKAASAHDIPAGHINLMVSAYNTGRTGKQRMSAQDPFDKAATFELADQQDIMSRLYPTNVKSASQKRDETIVDDEYAHAPVFAQRKEAAHVASRRIDWKMVDAPPEPYVGESHTAIKRAFHSVEFDKRRFEECRREVACAKDLLTSNFEKLSNYFRTPGGVSFDDACDVAEIQHGGMGRAILNQVSRIVPQFSKEAKHDCSAIHPSSTHEQWMAQKKKKRQEKHAGLVEVQPTQAPWTWIRECVKLAADVHEKQRTLHELSQHITKRAGDQILPFFPRQGRSVLNLPLPTPEKQSEWPVDEHGMPRSPDPDQGTSEEKLDWEPPWDVGPGYQRMDEAITGAAEKRLEEERREKLEQEEEKQSSMAPLYGGAAGLAGGGLLHYLKNKDKEEDEERSSLLGDLAIPTALGLGGGIAYDQFAGKPNEPTAGNPILEKMRAQQSVAEGAAAPGGMMSVDPNEALAGVDEAGNAIVPAGTPDQPAGEQTLQGAMPVNELMERSLANPDSTPPYVPRARNEFVSKPLPWTGEHDESYMAPPASSDPTGHDGQIQDMLARPGETETGPPQDMLMRPDRPSVFDPPDRPSVFDPPGSSIFDMSAPKPPVVRDLMAQKGRDFDEVPGDRNVYRDLMAQKGRDFDEVPGDRNVHTPLLKQNSAHEKQASVGSIFSEEKQSGIGSMYALSHLFKGVGEGMRGASAAEEDAISDYVEELDNPAHMEDMKRIQVRAQLENMMANDPVISLEDPAMVAEAYNEIVQLAPRAADSPLLMRNLLRQHLTTAEGGGGIMDPRDIGTNIIGNEKALQDVQQNQAGQVVGAPGQNAQRKSLVADADLRAGGEQIRSGAFLPGGPFKDPGQGKQQKPKAQPKPEKEKKETT